MSPVSVALPAPPFEVTLRGMWPFMQAVPSRRPETAGQNFDRVLFLSPALGHAILSSAAYPSGEWGIGWGSEGATGQVNRYDVRAGRSCMRWERNSAGPSVGSATILALPTWQPAYDPAALSPGFRANPSSAVLIFDVLCAAETAAPPIWSTNSAPFFWLPQAQGVTARCTPGYAADFGAPVNVGGFGLFLNDVGAVSTWQYVAWDHTYAILEAVSLPVADVTDFNLFRWQIITALPGQPAQLTLSLNGTVQLVREFGSPELQTPAAATQALANPGAIYGFGNAFRGQSTPIYSAWEFTCGRFTPDGREIQGI